MSWSGALLHSSWHLLLVQDTEKREHEDDRTGDLREAQEFASGLGSIPAMLGKTDVESSCLKGG